MYLWASYLWQVKEEYTVDKRQPLLNYAGKTGQLHVKEQN